MANPQKENGFIPIANEIAEKLARYRISGQEYQVIWVILRKTWGWHKKDDYISLSQMEKMTELKRGKLCKNIKKLVDKNIITSTHKGTTNVNMYRFNKDYERWLDSPHKGTPSPHKGTGGVPIRVPKVVPIRVLTKEKKETITKESTEASSDKVSFSLKEEIQKLEENPRRELNIIAFFLERKKPDIRSPGQLRVAIGRHIRTAKELIPFTDDQIVDAVSEAKKITEQWTLETLVKILTK